MRITILSQYYPPEIGAPQNRLSLLAEALVRRGHQVTVLTAMPNYPTGKIYPGYKGGLHRETIKGVQVIRTFIYPAQSPRLIPRLSNYFSFVLSSAMLGSFLLKPCDYLLVESPPLFLGLSGLWLSKLKDARLIFNVSDLWPESVVQLGMLDRNSLTYRVCEKLEAFFYHKAWLVSGQSKGILANINKRFPDCKTYLLSNGVDLDLFGPQKSTANARELLTGESKAGFVVLYAGLHGLAQSLENVIEAAEALTPDPSVQIVLVGDGPEKDNLVAQSIQRNLTNLKFLNPLPANAIPALLASSDALLVTLKKDLTGAVPSKLYEAMGSGRPVILMAGKLSEPGEIVAQNKVGLVITSGDSAGLAEAIRLLAESPELCRTFGTNGRLIAQEKFNRTRINDQFIDFLESIAQ